MKKLLISFLTTGILLFVVSAHALPIFWKGYFTKGVGGEAIAQNTLKATDGSVYVNLRYGGLKTGSSGKAKVNVSYKIVDSAGNAVQDTKQVLQDTEFKPDENGKVIVYFKMDVGSKWAAGKYKLEFAVKDLHEKSVGESKSAVNFTIE